MLPPIDLNITPTTVQTLIMARQRKNVLVAKQVVELTGSEDEGGQSRPPLSTRAKNKTISSFFQLQQQARTSKSETTQSKVKRTIKHEPSGVTSNGIFISMEPREVLDRIDSKFNPTLALSTKLIFRKSPSYSSQMT